MVYFKNICLILTVIFLKICNFSIFFNLCLILALVVIFSKFLKPNVVEMLCERERERERESRERKKKKEK
jgi:F0F1-type ATP synthase membrane subunit b/b'